MAQKIYVETTGELIVEDTTAGSKRGYPAYSELERNQNGDTLNVRSLGSNRNLVLIEDATDWETKAGSAYADGDALWTALDSYFDDTV